MPVAPTRPRPVPPLAWAAAALAVAAMSAWPVLTHRPRPATVRVPAGRVHTISLVWRRVSAPPRPAAVPVRPPVSRPNVVRIVEAAPAPSVSATPTRPVRPLPPAKPLPPAAPARLWAPARPARPGPQIALAATTAASALPPVRAALRRPVVKIADDRQEQQNLTPPAPDALPTVSATDPDQDSPQTPRDIPDAPPHLAHRVTPLYPASARAQGQEGAVTLRVSVDEDGLVSDIEIAESSGTRALDRAALQAVRRWEYDPAFRDGAPVPGTTTERIVFRLD